MNLCPTCRKLIYRTDDCKGRGVECGRTDGGKKSTAARADVRDNSTEAGVPAQRLNPAAATTRPAGSRPPPVDTPKRGRPRIHPDRKAYKAQNERERRAAKRSK